MEIKEALIYIGIIGIIVGVIVMAIGFGMLVWGATTIWLQIVLTGVIIAIAAAVLILIKYLLK